VFERFTERARHVMVLANEEARLLNANFIGTEHLLLGLIHEGEGVAAKALEQLGISLEAVREKVEETMGAPSTAAGVAAPFTPRAKKVLELSLREAMQLGHKYIGTEHILLGLVREGEDVGARILVDLGADLSQVRQQVIQLLSGYGKSVGHDELAGVRTRRPGPSGSPPDCPHCGSSLLASAGIRRMDLGHDDSGTSHAFVVVYCTACGASLALNPAT
jgi:ATP-dependent Clp protease ATP-binding subunit ClpC